MKKKELINKVISNLRTYELEAFIPIEEKDSQFIVAQKIQYVFGLMKKDDLNEMYNKLKVRERYENVGLIT